MKVYVITSGGRLDYYRIDAVCLDEKEAAKICVLLDKDHPNESPHCMHEYEANDINFGRQKGEMLKFRMQVGYQTGFVYRFNNLGAETSNSDNMIRMEYRCSGESRINIIATFAKGTSGEKAKKIMLDRADRFKEEIQGA